MDKLGWLFIFFSFFISSLQAQNVHEEISKIQKQKIDLFKKQKSLEEEAIALEKLLENLSLTYQEKKKHIVTHQKDISEKLPLLAHLGRANPLRILVDPKNSQNTLRGIILVRAFTAALKRQIQIVQAELEEITALTKDYKAKSQAHLKVLQEIELQQAQLLNLKTQKIEDWKKTEIQRLAEEDDINILLGESRDTLSKSERSASAAATAQGLPFRHLARPVVGKIIQDASLQEKFSPQSKGVIFETKKNAVVLSPAEGKVVFKGPFRKQGDILILDHGKKVQTIIMGMHKIDAHVGQNVYAGETLGTMAGYGAKPPKLYLELRHKGKAIDPQPYFIN